MADVDCRKVDEGNPGLGGTQYMFWYICSQLSLRSNEINVLLYANAIDKMPPFLNCRNISSNPELISQALKDDIDILIVRGPYVADDFYDLITDTKIKVITWCHNYERYPEINKLVKCKNIVRNICVGKEQLDRLVDNPLYGKSDYIYNTIQFDLYKTDDSVDKLDKSVCFLGSIIPEKGFHALARIWPEVEKKVPDAQLYVIGSGDYYNKKMKLGKYGIAYDEYEKSFVRYLLNNDNKLKSNVHFLGAMSGREKIELIKRMQIAVPKSTLTRETFNICAIEFEACGIPVVAGKKYSLLEVVSDGKTGLLFKNNKEFANDVIKLLTDSQCRELLGSNCADFVRVKFDENLVIEKWQKTIYEVFNDIEVKHEPIRDNLSNNKKRIRILNSRIRCYIPFVPSVSWWEDLPHSVKKSLKTIRKH